MSKIKKILLIVFVEILFLSNAYSQTFLMDSLVLNGIQSKSNTLLSKSLAPNYKVHLSFYEELVRDSVISEEKLGANCIFLEVADDEKARKNQYDILIEKWTLKGGGDFYQIKELIQELLNDSFYEKPPKVVLHDDKHFYIISTWGALYREKLYIIRDYLVNEHSLYKL